MRKNILIILFLFILANITFADDISNIVIEKNKNNITNETALNSHRNSISINFGSTIFYMLVAPSVVNILRPSNNSQNLKLQGTFGLDLTYTFRLVEKIDINVDAGFYSMKTYYNNSKAEYNGNVYGLGFSIGGRFYFNGKDRASGFFLMPKIGTTLFITQGKELQKSTLTYFNRNTNIWDFYISGEMGFRIDISRGLGVNSGVRPFFDISILDIGFSYRSLIRIVPLPRFAIGILF
ncbi:hypothetical protein [uncultured Brachyspira sp.]|uniref:hypothetical protein n=1 Tax=uncultured Brachyspira sp. TaxID=221953 RepID=UPI002627412A|nr:hypothetical protein [uncultured Brachyspira sp.]